ncbi:flavoprotein [Sphaerisporangium sp. NPDC004334]
MRAEPISGGVLYVVVCAAPAAASVQHLAGLAQSAGWTVRVITTPMAANFVDQAELERLTGDRVRCGYRMPDEPDEPDALPAADAVVVAPATFNTVNKWAGGIADTFAVGLLCELAGFGVPILAVPLLKDALARHPAFSRSLDTLRQMGSTCSSILTRPRTPACHLVKPPKRIWRGCVKDCRASTTSTRPRGTAKQGAACQGSSSRPRSRAGAGNLIRAAIGRGCGLWSIRRRRPH